MTNDLDTLATALCVKTDELLTDSPQFAPQRPAVGIVAQLSDAEPVALATRPHPQRRSRPSTAQPSLALTAPIWHNYRTGRRTMRALTAYDH